jgi:hypothetical protein
MSSKNHKKATHISGLYVSSLIEISLFHNPPTHPSQVKSSQVKQKKDSILNPTNLHIRIRHRIRPGPILNVVEIATHMLALIVGPVPTHALSTRVGCRVESEDIDVGETHEVYAEDLDAVVYSSVNTTFFFFFFAGTGGRR